MKRLVFCFDGTWNALADPTALTNVVKLANLVTVSKDNVEQVSYYNSGVGSGGFIDRYLGGIFGVGLKSNVKRGLTFLALNYEEKDEIYIFGFSRGAYTARALAGVISRRHTRGYQQRGDALGYLSGNGQVAARPPACGGCAQAKAGRSGDRVVRGRSWSRFRATRTRTKPNWWTCPSRAWAYGTPSGLTVFPRDSA